MFLGTYTPWFDSAISPWTTLGPLAFVISISLIVEGYSDYKRHLNDLETNTASCVVLTPSDEALLSSDGHKKLVRDMTIGKGLDVVVNINKAYYDANASSVRGLRQRSNTDPNDPAAEMVHIAFEKVPRQAIRQGQFVLVRNREMVPADLLLLASSNDQGGAYIETSSIDGETNLKLRNSPHLPKKILQALRAHNIVQTHGNATMMSNGNMEDDEAEPEFESLEGAIKRLTRFSVLGRPDGISALELQRQTNEEHSHLRPVVENEGDDDDDDDEDDNDDDNDGHDEDGKKITNSKSNDKDGVLNASQSSITNFMKDVSGRGHRLVKAKKQIAGHNSEHDRYIAALTTELPNASVHTFTGKLTLPPFGSDAKKSCHDIPLGPENILLRGAVIRNTEWALGVAVFTGNDTKLIRNSFATPSKFSQLDRLMNKTVVVILILMAIIFSYLAGMAVQANNKKFDDLFYIGYNRDNKEKWPYFPPELSAPTWISETQNWLQYFLLFITLLSNFIPLSLYVTVEIVQGFLLVLINLDLEMYDDTTNTRAVARSTIVSDLGRIQYIFSDKTGTLTQNVMRFKRCSVDGSAFGSPIQRNRPKNDEDEPEEELSSFHPLRQLMVGRLAHPAKVENVSESTENVTSGSNLLSRSDNKLTFHAEMFLRVMSLCHTVVVEKDIDKKKEISAGVSTGSQSSIVSFPRSIFKSNRKRADTGGSGVGSVITSSDVDFDPMSPTMESVRARTDTAHSFGPGEDSTTMKHTDGAPIGYAYQAESPDEGALVSAASLTFNFQVVGRDVHGIRLRCPVTSHLQDPDVVNRLKSNTLSLDQLAADTATNFANTDVVSGDGSERGSEVAIGEGREEIWTILAINKFDSDRKRMSILLRSPDELGSLPILFCKGADSSMLDTAICGGSDAISNRMYPKQTSTSSTSDTGGVDEANFSIAHLLGIQVHLGEFAKEGLRTLVLGMRILSEDECTEWLKEYKAASVSLKNRKELLTAAAVKIETGLHIVGATAIEDKLQVRVPETIATLEKAGIKLWVLTGDKRETAVEIGYSTNVLTSKMHLIEVPDTGIKQVRTQIAMEFIRLVKSGKLPQYQNAVLNNSSTVTRKQSNKQRISNVQFILGKWWRMCTRLARRVIIFILSVVGMKGMADKRRAKLRTLESAELTIMKDIERRRIVRDKAEEAIKLWINEHGGGKVNVPSIMADEEKAEETIDELGLTATEVPAVFNRATSARSLLNNIQATGSLSQLELRQISIAYLTAQQSSEGDGNDLRVVDEDTLSLESFIPSAGGGFHGDFDRKKRTLLERLFAIDKEVRKGLLTKHLMKDQAQGETDGSDKYEQPMKHTPSRGKRGLVIEGDALKHLLGDPQFEEILFAVASSCESVIACRVSPRQKALLVNLVRHNINPEPITLAIGDGANDVGMIQEAHVGVGISGKEGKQAVNASDFSIAQFRFLETLILIHGRWDFFRLSAVVLFSFYKNAVMAGTIILYVGVTVYSGTPLYDQWVLSMLNFVAAFPIIFVGLFDRCLSKDYVRKHPEVYRATRENELITIRSLGRWIGLCLVHMFTLYYCTVPQQSSVGGGITSAFVGLMRNNDPERPGDGEAGDLLSVGTVTFSCLIVLLAYKVCHKPFVFSRMPICAHFYLNSCSFG
jgi:magnesium-transporting ATPase (P-type)